jgi:hypothetical protein
MQYWLDALKYVELELVPGRCGEGYVLAYN